MKNWFDTLNASLQSEDLVNTFPEGYNLSYGQTIRYVADGLFVTIYRDCTGRYERPVHYLSKCDNFVQIISGE